MKTKNTRRGFTQIKRGGFTLIELLVVVLIIGILAAVAVSQYRLVVVKTRFTRALPLITSIKNTEEMIYLENGAYIRKYDLIAHVLPTNCSHIGSGVIDCGNGYYYISLMDHSKSNVSLAWCPEKIKNYISGNPWDPCRDEGDFLYRIWFAHSDYPNVIECISHTDLGKKMCHSITNGQS